MTLQIGGGSWRVSGLESGVIGQNRMGLLPSLDSYGWALLGLGVLLR